MSVHTRSQKLAQAAYARIAAHTEQGNKNLDKEYVSFAKKFPALIHTCGLAQAVAFAEAKGKTKDENKPKKPEMLYLEDLSVVLLASGHGEITTAASLAEKSRSEFLGGYLRLSRDAINAASWLKRYVEAAAPDEAEATS